MFVHTRGFAPVRTADAGIRGSARDELPPECDGSPRRPAMNTTLRTLDPALLARPVEGRNLTGATLGENLDGTTLLVFLRHFG